MDDESLPTLINRYQEAVIEWEEFKKEAKEKYEQNLLDMYPTDIAGDSEEIRKKRKKAIKSVKKAQYR